MCEVARRVLVQILVTVPVKALLKQNKLEHFLLTSQVKHSLQSSIQCQYSQTIVVISTAEALINNVIN